MLVKEGGKQRIMIPSFRTESRSAGNPAIRSPAFCPACRASATAVAIALAQQPDNLARQWKAISPSCASSRWNTSRDDVVKGSQALHVMASKLQGAVVAVSTVLMEWGRLLAFVRKARLLHPDSFAIDFMTTEGGGGGRSSSGGSTSPDVTPLAQSSLHIHTQANNCHQRQWLWQRCWCPEATAAAAASHPPALGHSAAAAIAGYAPVANVLTAAQTHSRQRRCQRRLF